MSTRRGFLAGMLATGLAPLAGWAAAGNPSFLSAARLPSGGYAIFGLSETGEILFEVPLPGRGHAAAAHPRQPLAVAFARRPGKFALVIDCVSGRIRARMEAPAGHHFSGHGVFSADGRVLFTSENDFDNARGVIGVWDAQKGYRRINAMPSGGVGPHDLRLMPDARTLLVANGGIETHPETGRAKLNLPEMRPNLSYISVSGELLEHCEPPLEWHRNSLRHLALREDGFVAVACQWQGNKTASPPLLATHRRGEPLRFCAGPDRLEQDMQGYAGSIAFSKTGGEIALTGPRGNLAAVFSARGSCRRILHRADICGVAPCRAGFAFTTGQGEFLTSATFSERGFSPAKRLNWDNHLIRVTGTGGT